MIPGAGQPARRYKPAAVLAGQFLERPALVDAGGLVLDALFRSGLPQLGRVVMAFVTARG